MKLHEISAAYKIIDDLLDDDTIEESRLLQAIDDVDDALQTKAQSVVALMQNLESTAVAIKEAEKRMAERRKAIERRYESIERYVLSCMQGAAISKIECPLFRISVQNNPPRCVIDDEKAIPIEYLRQPEPPPPMPDKRAMLEDMKLGVVIDGAHMENSQRLVIK